MIRESDLLDAIEECQRAKNPNASTCIKLAAYYTILQMMYPQEERPAYSYAYEGKSDFAKAITGKKIEDVMAIIDEAMTAVSVLQPRLYAGVLRKIEDLGGA